MKNLLYFTTMLFNAIGGLLSISLFFYISPMYLSIVPVIIISSVIFIISFTATIIDYNRAKDKIVPVKHRPYIVRSNNVLNYQEYFSKRKRDFIIA